MDTVSPKQSHYGKYTSAYFNQVNHPLGTGTPMVKPITLWEQLHLNSLQSSKTQYDASHQVISM